jgi:6-phosphogluconolactonase (cycloisomerase 2 family)
MNRNTSCSRRAFLQGIGYTSALGMLSKSTPAHGSLLPTSPLEFAYVASAGNGNDGSGIHAFEVRGCEWKRKQLVPSQAPASLTLHPNQRVLYVANEISEYRGLPRGTVEAYKINANDGALELINRQPLSLSGVRPKRLAISPDGKHLVVAIHGGGAYNVLPLGPDGSIGRVTQILKEVGAGPHPVSQGSAHPHSVVFESGRRYVFTTDEGCDRINVFAFQDGRIVPAARAACIPQSGPAHLAIHPSGDFLYIFNRLSSSIDFYHWRASTAEMQHEQRIQISPASGPHEHRFVLSMQGNFLYALTDEGISAWGIDSVNGRLSLRQQMNLRNRSLVSLAFSPSCEHLFAIDHRQQEILSIPVHAESGELGSADVAAGVPSPRSLMIIRA